MRAATVRRLGTLAAAALLGLSAVACATRPAAPPPAAAPTTTGSESDALPVLRDITAIGASTIKASPSPDWAVAAAGSVWVAGVGPGLQRYDATTGAVTGELAIYSVCSAMDQGFGSIWAMSCDYSAPKLVRIDAATGASTAEITMPARLPAESSVGASEGAVWLLTSGIPRQLLAVDPGTNTVARTLPAPDGATAVRAGLGRCGCRSPPRTAGSTGPRLRPGRGDDQCRPQRKLPHGRPGCGVGHQPLQGDGVTGEPGHEHRHRDDQGVVQRDIRR